MKTFVVKAVFALLLATISVIDCASAAPHLLWKKQLGTAADDQVRFLRGDATGNVVIAYQYSAGTPGSETWAYAVVKYDPSGKKLWQRNQNADFFGLAVDLSGNVYAFVDNYPNPSLVKYAPDGTLLWRRSPTTGYGSPVGFTVDSTEHPIAVYGGCSDCNTIYIVSFSLNGNIAWKRNFSITNTTRLEISGVEADANRNVIVAGITTGLTRNDYYDDKVWIAKLTSGGTLTLLRTFNDVSLASIANLYVNGIAIDDAGNIILAGFAAGDLSGRLERCGAAYCVFVGKFGADGTPAWTNVFQYSLPHGGYTDSEAEAVITAPSGEIVISGHREVLKAQDSLLYSRPLVATLAHDGTLIWDWYWPVGASNDYASWLSAGVSVDALGNIAFGGRTYGALAGPYKGIPGDGYTDGFVAKLAP